MTTNVLAAITETLLAWFYANKRDLPWRYAGDTHPDAVGVAGGSRDAYRIWVSEVMLQQTQVPTVIPYYERFLQRFPSICDLAAASLDDVLAEWQGLGYYARARNLHAAARLVCERYGGVLPANRAELEALPGIGEYTAGAILSIAYGQDEPIIDVNVARVLCRLFDYSEPLDKAVGKKALRRYALALLLQGRALLPKGRAGDWNQAIMELGATLCSARTPRCEECPVAQHCQARAWGIQEQRPLPKRRPEMTPQELVVAVVEKDGQTLIVRRKPDGLLGGLWELPGGVITPDEDHAQALARHLRNSLGLDAQVGAHLATVRHAYSRFQVTVYVYRCRISGEPQPANRWDAYHWLAAHEIGAYGLTGVATRVLSRVS